MQNGVHYTLDLNTGLTQILSDGITTYLYGLGRIAQTGTTTEYYLGDALGSVRQLVDEAGTLTLAKFYAPYGEVMYSAGAGQTDYGFTGETTDVNGLVYLRARYYAPEVGRFLSRDTWNGSVNRPLSLNRWMYVEGNPINYRDPSGKYVDCPPGTVPAQSGCVQRPPIVGRNQWGALPPEQQISCYYGICADIGEGFYDAVKNIDGYALCSDLFPGQSLAEVYTDIVIHHAGNQNNPSIQEVQNEHFERGFADIGYHYIVAKDGIIYEGRDIQARGAHVEGANSHKIGILVVGDFEPGDYVDTWFGEVKISNESADVPTRAQRQALDSLIAYLDASYGIDIVAGHNHYNNTRCPGDNLEPLVGDMNRKYGEGY